LNILPDFALERTNGRALRLSAFRARSVLMRFTRAVTDKIL
jgi:peroxiredoxin